MFTKLFDKKKLGLIASLLCFSASAQAGLIQWTYQATIVKLPTTSDPLGINGQTATLSLTFDDSNTWQKIDGQLYFPTASANASITGGNPVALDSASPAGFHFPTPSAIAAITVEIGNSSFVGLTIDGEPTQMGSFQGISSAIPLEGEHLLLAHLPTSIPNAKINYPAGTTAYSLINSSVTANAVPESPILLMLGLGLAVTGFARKRKQA